MFNISVLCLVTETFIVHCITVNVSDIYKLRSKLKLISIILEIKKLVLQLFFKKKNRQENMEHAGGEILGSARGVNPYLSW